MSLEEAGVKEVSAHRWCFVFFSPTSDFPLLLNILEVTSGSSSIFVGLPFEQIAASLSVIITLI